MNLQQLSNVIQKNISWAEAPALCLKVGPLGHGRARKGKRGKGVEV